MKQLCKKRTTRKTCNIARNLNRELQITCTWHFKWSVFSPPDQTTVVALLFASVLPGPFKLTLPSAFLFISFYDVRTFYTFFCFNCPCKAWFVFWKKLPRKPNIYKTVFSWVFRNSKRRSIMVAKRKAILSPVKKLGMILILLVQLFRLLGVGATFYIIFISLIIQVNKLELKHK